MPVQIIHAQQHGDAATLESVDLHPELFALLLHRVGSDISDLFGKFSQDAPILLIAFHTLHLLFLYSPIVQGGCPPKRTVLLCWKDVQDKTPPTPRRRRP